MKTRYTDMVERLYGVLYEQSTPVNLCTSPPGADSPLTIVKNKLGRYQNPKDLLARRGVAS